jgi:hypothetical protein
MFAFIQSDKDPDDEGVTAWNFYDVFKDENNWMPLMGADMKRVESLKPIAQQIADKTRKPVQLVKFTCRTDLETINPTPKEPKTNE